MSFSCLKQIPELGDSLSFLLDQKSLSLSLHEVQ